MYEIFVTHRCESAAKIQNNHDILHTSLSFMQNSSVFLSFWACFRGDVAGRIHGMARKVGYLCAATILPSRRSDTTLPFYIHWM